MIGMACSRFAASMALNYSLAPHRELGAENIHFRSAVSFPVAPSRDNFS